jgi:WD40 repeat protein
MEPVRRLAFSPDSRILASGDEYDNIRLWDTAAYTLRHTLTGHKFQIDSLAFSPDSSTLASGGWDSRGKRVKDTVRLWDVATGSLRHTLADYVGGVWDLAFSPDGRTLASAGRGHVARLFDVATGSLRHILDHESYIWHVAFSPDGRSLATGGQYTLKLWDTDAGILRHTLWTPQVTSLAFSPDGRILASASWGYGNHLLDVATGSVQHALDDTSVVRDVAFSPDSRTLASVGEDYTVRLWNADTGTLQHTLKGHTDSVNFVALHPDGRTLASTGEDHTIRLWDVATGSLRYVLEGHARGITSLLFSPDGRTLASGSKDGTILLWDVVSEAAAGDFRNLVTNPNGHWAVWKSRTTVTVRFSSPRAPVQYHARQDPQPQFVLPEGFRPATRVTHTVTGTPVHADGTPVPDSQPVTFDLTIDPNGEVRYLDNAKVDELGYVGYRVTHLTWQTGEPPSALGTEASPTVDSDASN